MFFIIGICIAVFLSLLLLIKRNKTSADKLLFGWMILIVVHQVLFYTTLTEDLYSYPFLLGVEMPLPILHGVFLFIYTIEVTRKVPEKKSSLLLHLIPFLVMTLLMIPFFILSPELKVEVYKNEGAGFEWYMHLSNIVIPLSGLIYSIWSISIVRRHQRSIKDSFSNIERKELLWLKYLSLGYAVIWIISVFSGGPVIFSAVVVLVLFMGIFGINQLNIFYSNIQISDTESQGKVSSQNEDDTITPVKLSNEKYAKSGLTNEMANKIYHDLNKLKIDQSFYKDGDITLVELSNRLHVHPNHLSQVINEMEEKNFYNYINSLRIEEFIKLASLPENKKYTMIALAYDCGFSTKSTFNKHFKIVTGKTPTEFFKS